MNKLEVSEELVSDELCDLGQDLWEDFRAGEYDANKYKKYVEHIKLCEICKKGLEIDEVINKNDLIEMTD